jgi:hypothetical protein
LLLQKMENRLVRHHLETPDVFSSEEHASCGTSSTSPGSPISNRGCGSGRDARARGRIHRRRNHALAGQGRRRPVRTAARGA